MELLSPTSKDVPYTKQKDQGRTLTGNLLVSHWHMLAKFHYNLVQELR